MTTQNFSQLKTRARKIAKIHGVRWAASFLMNHGYSIEKTMQTLFPAKG